MPVSVTRGQTYVLEAIGAGILVLAAVVFTIQATAVTPLSVSTANKHIENQEQAMAETLLEQAASNGTLKEAVLYWNPDERKFQGAETVQGYLDTSMDGPPPNRFGYQLERVFADSRIATNIYVFYSTRSGTKSKTMVYQGTPSDNAVTATHSLLLVDADNLTASGYENHTLNATNTTVSFYAPDVFPDGRVYNVVEVRLVVWQM